jgi:hypothetical protein
MLFAAYKEEYAPNEKIIVYHYDTDYYIENTGFCLHNFLQCLKFLNISPSVIVMLTNHHGIEKEIKTWYSKNCIELDYNMDHMLIFESNHTRAQTTPTPLPTNLDQNEISFPFICLFGSKRVHRVAFFSMLKQNHTLEQGLCAWGNNTRGNKTVSEYHTPAVGDFSDQPMPYAPEFLITVPFNRINENWPMNQQLVKNYRQFEHFYDDAQRHPAIVGEVNENRFDQPAVKKALLYVSAETVFQYPYPYLTEKTFRAIIHKRPFVILGAVHSLKLLQDLGFKTFSNFWSEEWRTKK